jgi:hypothetical protein
MGSNTVPDAEELKSYLRANQRKVQELITKEKESETVIT